MVRVTERATRGCREINPARSRVSSIWCTEGGLTRKKRRMSASAGARPGKAPVGVDEGEVLPLPRREAGSTLRGGGVHLEPSMRGGRDEHTLPGGVERGGARRP